MTNRGGLWRVVSSWRLQQGDRLSHDDVAPSAFIEGEAALYKHQGTSREASGVTCGVTHPVALHSLPCIAPVHGSDQKQYAIRSSSRPRREASDQPDAVD